MKKSFFSFSFIVLSFIFLLTGCSVKNISYEKARLVNLNLKGFTELNYIPLGIDNNFVGSLGGHSKSFFIKDLALDLLSDVNIYNSIKHIHVYINGVLVANETVNGNSIVVKNINQKVNIKDEINFKFDTVKHGKNYSGEVINNIEFVINNDKTVFLSKKNGKKLSVNINGKLFFNIKIFSIFQKNISELHYKNIFSSIVNYCENTLVINKVSVLNTDARDIENNSLLVKNFKKIKISSVNSFENLHLITVEDLYGNTIGAATSFDCNNSLSGELCDIIIDLRYDFFVRQGSVDFVIIKGYFSGIERLSYSSDSKVFFTAKFLE